MNKAGKVAAVAAAAVVGLTGVGTGVWASTHGATDTSTLATSDHRYPGGMMGSYPSTYYPGGMMGVGANATIGSWMTGGRFGLAGDGRSVGSLAAARGRAQVFANRLGLRVGEVMRFSNGYYAELTSTGGRLATEVLINPADGGVSLEYGPAMMWNTVYGMHPFGDAPARVSAAQARQLAATWLRTQGSAVTTGEPDVFPGYYTMHTLTNGHITGMLSVNATTGAVWYHSWHGRYIAMSES